MTRRRFAIPALLALLLLARTTSAREVVDIRGRKVVIPDRIERVFATSPPGTYLVYAIDPTLLIGLNFPIWENEKKYTVKRFQTLPVIGGAVGMGRTINQEVLMKTKPDVIVVWDWHDTALNAEYEAIFRRMGIPWVYVRLDTIWDYPESLSFLGDVLGRPARGKALRDRAVAMLEDVKSAVRALPKGKPLKVYYAEGPDGLSTEGTGSFHAELIEVAGGHNVHQGKSLMGMGMEHISLEQVMAYDPDVILIKEKAFHDSIYQDPRWSSLRAVRARRAHLIPYVPFNWFDRPPSFMRLLGAQWVFSILHPEKKFPNLRQRTQDFYRTFLGVELDGPQAAEVLGR